MEKIYSKIDPNLLLHVIHRFEDFDKMNDFRNDIIEADNFIQCAALKMDKDKTFRPHKHLIKEVTDYDRIAQESWVVLRGKVKCIFYDIDDTIIAEPILCEGDASFTLRGGHNYYVLEDNSKILEFKTGKYLGQKFDKVFIEK
jgi:hypothetical protein